MIYSTDKPIENKEHDLLGRASFSYQLGKAIYEYKSSEGLVIGLFGKWGTGKTSLINMSMDSIDEMSKDESVKPLVMRYAPWNFSDKDNLINIFFEQLKNLIEVQGKEELKRKVGKALKEYSGAFDALSLVPVFGSGLSALFKTIAQAQGEALMQVANLDQNREILEKALLEVNEKIIIIIDDIDRLANSQIRDVFQLVKQVADFPNIIYILAMDRDVVRSALSEVHNIDGNEYLEKIIQVPLEIPELKKNKLHDIFLNKLEVVVSGLSGAINWDRKYWGHVFKNCVDPYLNTLRDVNRMINTFQFRYGMIFEETSFEDMVALTTLEVLEPGLYRWIAGNKDALCGGIYHSIFSSNLAKTDYKKLYSDELKSLGLDSEKSINCVSTLFPVFAKDVGKNQFMSQVPNDIRGNMRVAHEERFDIYFMLDLEDVKISRKIINACISKFNEEELSDVINEINENGDIAYFLEELRVLVSKIPYQRLQLIASTLINLQGKLEGENQRVIFAISSSEMAGYIVSDIIKRLNTEDEVYEVIKPQVENIEKSGLGTVARIINKIELAHGRLASKSISEDEQLISLEHLLDLEKIYINRIKEITKVESIFDIKDFMIAFYIWKSFDKESAESYLAEMFKEEINILKFICVLADEWNGSEGRGWSFNLEYYSSYISKEELYELIEKYSHDRLDLFDELEQIKLASFVLNYDRSEFDHVNEREAIELIKKWKQQND